MIIAKYLCILLICVILAFSGCGKMALVSSKESICLIPEGFTGPVFIIFSQQDGVTPNVEDGRNVYKIPADGILQTKVPVNRTVNKNEFFYVDSNNVRKPIDYLFGKAYPVEVGERSFDNIDIQTDEIFAMSDEMGTFEKEGEYVHIRQFLIGKPKNSNELHLRRIKLSSKISQIATLSNN